MIDGRMPCAAAVLALALFAACPAPAQTGEDDATASPDAVQLDIVNQTDGPIRCMVILAHFVTRDLAPIAPGEVGHLLLDRNPASGELAHGAHAGRPMLVENILCGGPDWDMQRADLPLTGVRTGAAAYYRATCSLADRFACEMVVAAEDG